MYDGPMLLVLTLLLLGSTAMLATRDIVLQVLGMLTGTGTLILFYVMFLS